MAGCSDRARAQPIRPGPEGPPRRERPCRLLVALAWLLLASCGVFVPAPGCGEQLPLETIRLPPGFAITSYATGVDGARSLARSPRGTVFVGSRGAGKVYALPDRDGDHVADEVITVASGLTSPNGVAFRDGALFVAEIGRVLRFDDIEARLHDPPAPSVVTDDLPKESHHGWKFIRFGPDGLLYVPVGAPCNVCEREDPRFAAILRMRPDGTEQEVYARGIRNTVGFDWDHQGDLWFTDNGRDWLGDDLPPDELNHAARPGLHFGFPYRYGDGVPDPEFGDRGPAVDFVPPALHLGAHVAPLGMRFYRGGQFPERYRDGIFIAEHGSWNRSSPVGYRVAFVPMPAGRPGTPEAFAEGWLRGARAWGRPVDVEALPDGSLLVSDDRAGAIYRVSFVSERAR